jgi:hydroxymethylbilane synthase
VNLVLATRGSALALWQANEAKRLLLAVHRGSSVELLTVQSTGDKDAKTELSRFDLTGIFTAEVDHAVLAGTAHAGVHSLKDVPTLLPDGLVLASVLARGAPEDVLVSRERKKLLDLPRGARVATGSIRRIAMVKHLRPDLEIVAIRGNVDTRLSKLERGDADALVMAKAGLERLGLGRVITEVLDASVFLPAVGQGIVGLICRGDDAVTVNALRMIGNAATFAEAQAERALLHALHGGCNAPIGCRARAVEETLRIHARVYSADGREVVEDRLSGETGDAVFLGEDLARHLAERGAKRLIDAARAR